MLSNVCAPVTWLPDFRETCSQASKACRSCDLLNSWKTGEVRGKGADFPVSSWLRRHTNAHNLTPRFPLPETQFVSTVWNRSWFWAVTIVSTASRFYLNAGWSQLQQWIITEVWFPRPQETWWKNKSPVSHFYSPFLVAKHLQSQNGDRITSPPRTSLPQLNGPSTLKGLN